MAKALAVNTQSKPYHHGDLRAALVRAGMDLLATREVDDLSLREIARTVGVSASAVYRHFPDKEALMGALAAEGLHMLYLAQRAESERAGGGVAGFNATGCAYVRFALDNSALFRQIFASPPRTANLAQAVDVPDAMAFLRANAAQFATSPAEVETVALQAWSLAHGLAMLLLDDQIAFTESMVAGIFTHWANNLAHASRASGRPRPKSRPRTEK